MAAEARTVASIAAPSPVRAWSVAVHRLTVHAVKHLGWGVADQAASSVSNFAVSIFLVRALGPAQFGAFSLAYVTYGFALNASRGLSTDPLMVRFSGVPVRKWRRATADCTGSALVVGLAIGICVIAAGILLSGPARSAFIALGLTLPGLMLQDSWRFAFFAARRGGHAFLNDSIWAVTLIPMLALLSAGGHANVFDFTIAWGATGSISALAGIIQAKLIPRPRNALNWCRRQGDLGVRYFLEGTSGSAATQVTSYGLVALLGLASVGYLQATVTLFGPINILGLGISLVAIPEGARVLRQSPKKLPLFCWSVSFGLVAASVAWGIVLLIAVPKGLGAWMLHSAWQPIYPLLLPTIIGVVGGILTKGAGVGMHSLGAAQRSLRVVLLGSLLSASGALAGAALGGLVGALYGMAVSAWVSAAISWRAFGKAMQEHKSNETNPHAIRPGRRSGKHRRRRSWQRKLTG
jgi:O-antigen/teichoic acid export membrane protein